MELKILGKPRNIEKTLVRKAAKSFINKLMSERLQSKLNVGIVFTADLPRNQYGACTPITYDSKYPEDFIIEIRRDNNREMSLRTLAHELVHVKQYAQGKLYNYERKNDRVRWKKRSYKFDPQDRKYMQTPWEKEALNLEAKLYYEHLKETKQK